MGEQSTNVSDRGKGRKRPVGSQPNGDGAAAKSRETAAESTPQGIVANRVESLTAKVRGMRPTAAIAIAIAAGFLAWLLFIRGDDDSGKAPSAAAKGPGQVTLVSSSGLVGAVAGAGYPVYWVGPQPGNRYEVTRPGEGKLQVRYIPSGESAGTQTPYLSVSSYMQSHAYETIEKLSARHGLQGFEVAHGGIAYVDRDAPNSVYVAYPGVPTQIEVNDPHPGRAQALVRSGIVTPIG